MHDLLIRGGLVVDGTGLPGRPADVAVSGGKVTAIGRLAGEAAHRVIDADGLVVAPGIVDAHTHYDPQLTWDPLCDTSALHGVTTVAAGNCGFSVAPCRPDDHEYVAQLFARVEGMELSALSHVGWNFATFGEYLASRSGTLGVNLGMYVGHSAIRRWLLGDEAYERAATEDEIAAMAGGRCRAGSLRWTRCGRSPMRSGAADGDPSRTHPAARSRASTRMTVLFLRNWPPAAECPSSPKGSAGVQKWTRRAKRGNSPARFWTDLPSAARPSSRC